MYEHQNCYAGHGGTEIDTSPASGLTAAQCAQRCSDDPECDCATFDTSGDGDCWKRSGCVPAQFESDAAAQAYSVLVKAAPAGYSRWSGQNAYGGHGATDIDAAPATGLTPDQCAGRCSADAQCQCVTYCATKAGACPAAGACWRRGACRPAGFEHDAATAPFTVFLQAGVPTPAPPAPPSNGPLAYLKHDSMGPAGDAAILVFNPFGAAANVTVDLSRLAGTPVLNGRTVPYDLLASNGTAPTAAEARGSGVPPLSASWTVEMGAGEFKFFGGFSLGVFAPRQGKRGGCRADDAYSKMSNASTLQGCFLECLADAKCENVRVGNVKLDWVRAPLTGAAPPAVQCTLLGAVEDPAASCAAGDGTLVRRLPGARSCAHLWTGRGREPARRRRCAPSEGG